MSRHFTFAVLAGLCLIALSFWWSSFDQVAVHAQEQKRFMYKIVDVPADNASMQNILNEYGAAGWELVVVGMGDMTSPRLIFKR